SCCREDTTDVAANRAGADDRDLHGALLMPATAGETLAPTTRMCERNGLRTKSAIAAARKFATLAARKTARHPPPPGAIRRVSGTRSAADPFAVYRSPAFALAYFDPNVSAHVAGNRL